MCRKSVDTPAPTQAQEVVLAKGLCITPITGSPRTATHTIVVTYSYSFSEVTILIVIKVHVS